MDNKDYTYTVGVPTFGIMRHQFVESLISLVGSGLIDEVCVVPRLPHHQARTRVVKLTKTSHLLFVDDDVVFTPEDVELLMKADKDIVSGLCYSRTDKEERPIVYRFNEETGRFNIRKDFDKDKLQPVDGATIAFCLIKMEVFAKVGMRFVFGIDPPYGEDEEFMHRLRDAGIQSWLEPRARVGHLTDRII